MTVDVTSAVVGVHLNVLAVGVLVTDNGSNEAPVVTSLTVNPRLVVVPPAPVPAMSGWFLVVAIGLLALIALQRFRGLENRPR